jgi:hypothetical protein
MYTENIEDTIFEDNLPVNIYPMLTRMQEIVNDCRHKGLDYRKDKRAEKCMWLIVVTYLEDQLGTFSLSDWYMQLAAQEVI